MKPADRIAAAFQQAVTYYRQGRLDDAEALCRSTLKGRTAHPAVLRMLGIIQLRKGRPAAAVEWFDRFLKLEPDTPDVWGNRGFALQDLHRLDEALASYDRALKLKPDYPEALNNRGNLLFSGKRFDEAAQSYARLVAAAPSWPYCLGSLHCSRMSSCDWTDFDKLSADIVACIERGEPADDPLSFTWHSQSAALQLRCSEIYVARDCPPPKYPLPPPPRTEHGRIRLAYLSPDLREHAVAHSFAGLFERHDRTRFEVTALSYGENDGSPMRSRLEKAFDRFIDIRDMDDVKAAQLIRQEQIDIVVDIAGFSGGHRAKILALRPAPIQVNQQGFPATMGAPFIDYIVADRHVIPDRLKAFYREKVVRLPDSYLVSDDAQPIAGDPPSRSDAGLPERGFVFCSFNNSYKIVPAVFDVWMRLLRAIDGSVMWLRYESESAAVNLRREAERRGVPAHRLVFAHRIDLAQHLARHRLADLFVDTFPYTAHSTASHALWAGVPVLTLRGETFVSRVASSLLHTAGLPECVVDSLSEYEALALKLATNSHLLAELREKLERSRATSPLFDTDRFRQHIESAYVTMYQRYQRGDAPATFDVPAIS
jgi:protein O-GlcNAc transferase